MPVAENRQREDCSWCRILPQNIKRASCQQSLRQATKAKQKRRATHRSKKPQKATVSHSEPPRATSRKKSEPLSRDRHWPGPGQRGAVSFHALAERTALPGGARQFSLQLPGLQIELVRRARCAEPSFRSGGYGIQCLHPHQAAPHRARWDRTRCQALWVRILTGEHQRPYHPNLKVKSFTRKRSSCSRLASSKQL